MSKIVGILRSGVFYGLAGVLISALVSCYGIRKYNPFNPKQPSREELLSYKKYAIKLVPESNGNEKYVPYGDTVRRLFGYAGIQFVDEKEAVESGFPRIVLRPVTLANGAYYNMSNWVTGKSLGRQFLYSGAETYGYIDIATPTKKLLILNYSGYEPLSRVALGNEYKTVADAPYDRALGKPGGFYEVILNHIVNVYGEEPLFQALLDSNRYIRLVDIQMCSDRNLKGSIPYLEKTIVRYDDIASEKAMDLLDRFDSRSSAPAVLKALERNGSYAARAADMLGKWKYREALPVMIRMMPSAKQSQDYKLPYSLIQAFKSFNDRSAVPVVIQYIETNDRLYPQKLYDARKEAIEFLEAISGQKLGNDVSVWKEWWKKGG